VTSFTVFGGTGFIGTHLVRRLRATGGVVQVPARGDLVLTQDLGTVFYCIGLTSDFRTRPYETVEAHVDLLARILKQGRFTGLVYLSSTRIYKRILDVAREDSPIAVAPNDPDDLYGISKVMGEAIGFASGKPFKAARLSNVYGPDLHSDNFLSTVVRLAVGQQMIVLETHPETRRDYVAVDHVVDLLIRIASEGVHDIYNIASGETVSTSAIAEGLHQLTGCEVQVSPAAATSRSPSIDVTRIRNEFGFASRRLLDDLPDLVEAYRRRTEEWR
jgi:nucleoside-diphosphate-sugar epimerase